MKYLAALVVASFLLAACSTVETEYQRYQRVYYERPVYLLKDGSWCDRACPIPALVGPLD
jgi:hypothetical protein